MQNTSMLFFRTSIGLATQMDYLISQMNLALSSLLTSTLMALRIGLEKRRIDCFIGLAFG
jgi:hypothetical protein